MKIYYAHPMSWYNTDEEAKDIAFLKEQFPNDEIINPNHPLFEAKVQLALIENRNTMDVFTNYIKNEVDMVVYRAFNDNMVGAGVAREVFEAHMWGKRSDEIRSTASNGCRYLWGYSTMQLANVLTVLDTKQRVKDGII